MAKVTIGAGLEKMQTLLADLNIKAPAAMGHAIYKGAEIVADRMRAEIESIEVSQKEYAPPGYTRYPTQTEIDGMLSGLGISRKQTSGSFANVKIGMDGYNGNGVANAMVARSINKGTSFLKRIPFIDRTRNGSRGQAESVMAETIESELNQIVDEVK